MLNLLNPVWMMNNWLTCHWVGAAIGAAGSLAGGMMGGDSAEDAAEAQAEAAQAAIEEQRRLAERTNKQTLTYRQSGNRANRMLADLMGLGSVNPEYEAAKKEYNKAKGELESLTSGSASSSASSSGRYINPLAQGVAIHPWMDMANGSGSADQALISDARRRMQEAEALMSSLPKDAPRSENFGSLLANFSEDDLANDVVYNSGLQFGLDEGMKAIERRAASNGGLDSGATLKAAMQYGNDYASTKAAGAYDRFMNDKGFTYNTLSGVTDRGLQAVGLNAGVNTGVSNNVSDLMTGAGNAKAAGIVGSANAWGNAFSGVGNAVNQYQTNQILDTVLRGQSGYGGGY